MNLSALRDISIFGNKEEAAVKTTAAITASPVFVAILVLAGLGIIYFAVTHPAKFFDIFIKVMWGFFNLIFKIFTVIGTILVKIIMLIFRKKH